MFFLAKQSLYLLLFILINSILSIVIIILRPWFQEFSTTTTTTTIINNNKEWQPALDDELIDTASIVRRNNNNDDDGKNHSQEFCDTSDDDDDDEDDRSSEAPLECLVAGFILLNISIALDLFWTPINRLNWQTFHNHLHVLFVMAIDLNLIFGSILMAIFQLLPIDTDNIEQHSSSPPSSSMHCFLINLTSLDLRFVANFLTTGSILTLFRWKILPNSYMSPSTGNYDVPLLMCYFGKILHHINVFLFRKSSTTHRNRYDDRIQQQYSSISNRMSSSMIDNDDEDDDDQYVSQDDDEEFLSNDDDLDMEFDMDMDRILLERLFAGSPNLCHSTASSSSEEDNYLHCMKQTTLETKNSSSMNVLLSKDVNKSNGHDHHVDNEIVVVHDIIMKKTTEIRKKVLRKRRSGGNGVVHKCTQQQPEQESNSTHRPEWMIDQHDCTVCLEPYRSEQLIMGLACGHNYHQPCIAQWLCRGNHRCPICRWPSYRLRHPRQHQHQHQHQQQQQISFKHHHHRLHRSTLSSMDNIS
ncbi:hypothetical protein DERF_011502 [Dermatophagoides farinae]|uniref:RING-type domain-containing protein n=1 Tax=Dermatophagoides farinae TaxID=6954 RepID=A0A922HV08_DERFA|nr:hypothetical protein DERF_011502 [Dermatophagoides farinae]